MPSHPIHGNEAMPLGAAAAAGATGPICSKFALRLTFVAPRPDLGGMP